MAIVNNDRQERFYWASSDGDVAAAEKLLVGGGVQINHVFSRVRALCACAVLLAAGCWLPCPALTKRHKRQDGCDASSLTSVTCDVAVVSRRASLPCTQLRARGTFAWCVTSCRTVPT